MRLCPKIKVRSYSKSGVLKATIKTKDRYFKEFDTKLNLQIAVFTYKYYKNAMSFLKKISYYVHMYVTIAKLHSTHLTSRF